MFSTLEVALQCDNKMEKPNKYLHLHIAKTIKTIFTTMDSQAKVHLRQCTTQQSVHHNVPRQVRADDECHKLHKMVKHSNKRQRLKLSHALHRNWML